MRAGTLLILFLVAGFFCPDEIFAQQPPQETVSAVDSAAARADVTGLALAAIADGEVAWTHAYGVRSTVTEPPVTPETVFEAAALGMPVLAYITMRLADEGVLNLDRPLAEYWTYEDLAHDDRYLELTARTVLMHGTGLPNWRVPGTQLDFLIDPGLSFSYSGEAFLFLQRVVEHITGRSVDALGREYVFEPFEMTSSGFVWCEDFEPHVAAGHSELGGALNKFIPEVPNAAFSLHTTAGDYARFLAAAGTGKGLSAEMTHDFSMAQMDAGDGIYWGLGWGLQPGPAGMSLWQWGDTVGFKAFAYLEPGAERGFVYLSNSNNGMLVLEEVFEQMIGGSATAVRWLQYEQADEPSFALGSTMIEAYNAGGLDSMMSRYEDARGELPQEAYAEGSLNTLGYKFLRLGMHEEAVAVFKLNTEVYPQAYNTYDSLAEAYVTAGMPEEALEAYRRSVDLNPSHNRGWAMIARLEQQIESSSSEEDG